MMDFYLYFPLEEKGREAILSLTQDGFALKHFKALEYNGKTTWSLLVSRTINEHELESWEMKLETLARQFDGKYDGYERLVS